MTHDGLESEQENSAGRAPGGPLRVTVSVFNRCFVAPESDPLKDWMEQH